MKEKIEALTNAVNKRTEARRSAVYATLGKYKAMKNLFRCDVVFKFVREFDEFATRVAAILGAKPGAQFIPVQSPDYTTPSKVNSREWYTKFAQMTLENNEAVMSVITAVGGGIGGNESAQRVCIHTNGTITVGLRKGGGCTSYRQYTYTEDKVDKAIKFIDSMLEGGNTWDATYDAVMAYEKDQAPVPDEEATRTVIVEFGMYADAIRARADVIIDKIADNKEL